MGQLVFTPWYNVYQNVQIGPYNLISFDTKKINPGLGQLDSDAKIILKNYLTTPFTAAVKRPPLREFPVETASLIISSSNDPVLDLERLQYIISLCAISDREFTDSHRYLGTDNLKIHIQKYPDPIQVPFDPYIETKTKMGSSGQAFSADLFREVKPWYITHQKIYGNSTYRLIFNEELAQCLWVFSDDKIDPKKSLWEENIYPSLFSFHYANTDGSTNQVDCIYSEAAIEKLFLGEDYSEKKLIEKVLDFLKIKNLVFETYPTSSRNWQSITYQENKKPKQCSTILEAWLRELVRFRNLCAHGGFQPNGNEVWSLSEHLLLSSFLYPLFLKLMVSNFDSSITFKISDEDFKKLRMTERLLAEINYSQDTSRTSGMTKWGKIISDSRLLV